MPDLPVVLRVRGRRCVVVGGGEVACRRAAALCEAGADVLVVAGRIEPAQRQTLNTLSAAVNERRCLPSDLDGAFLVVVATDDAKANREIAAAARARGALVNRADEPEEGDLVVPAHAHHGGVTVAVHTGGASASAAGAIRRELSAAMDPDWPRLLAIVGPFREKIRREVADPDRRREQLRKLTADMVMEKFKKEGPEALQRYCEELAFA